MLGQRGYVIQGAVWPLGVSSNKGNKASFGAPTSTSLPKAVDVDLISQRKGANDGSAFSVDWKLGQVSKGKQPLALYQKCKLTLESTDTGLSQAFSLVKEILTMPISIRPKRAPRRAPVLRVATVHKANGDLTAARADAEWPCTGQRPSWPSSRFAPEARMPPLGVDCGR